MGKTNAIHVKSKLFMRIWMFVATAGSGLVCLWMFLDGLKFESRYSLIYILVGFFGTTFGLITFLSIARIFTRKGRVVFSILPGENGKIISRKQSVYLKDIKNIELKQEFKLNRPRTLFFEDLIIRTSNNKIIRIPTYNLLVDRDFQQNVENYALPFMAKEAQQDWKRRYEKNTPA
jgi:hypothetical protein